MRSMAAPPATSRPPRYSTSRGTADRKSTRLNSSHANISYAVFCLKKNAHFRSFRSVARLLLAFHLSPLFLPSPPVHHPRSASPHPPIRPPCYLSAVSHLSLPVVSF